MCGSKKSAALVQPTPVAATPVADPSSGAQQAAIQSAVAADAQKKQEASRSTEQRLGDATSGSILPG
jgi:hypothetical protein